MTLSLCDADGGDFLMISNGLNRHYNTLPMLRAGNQSLPPNPPGMQNALWNEVLSFGAGPLCDMYMPEGCARQAFRVCRVAMACRTRMCDALGVSRVGVHTVNSALLNTF